MMSWKFETDFISMLFISETKNKKLKQPTSGCTKQKKRNLLPFETDLACFRKYHFHKKNELKQFT